MDPNPYMFDGTTLKSSQALAKNAIEAMGNDSKVIVIDENRLSNRRNQDRAINYLNDLGFS